MGKAQVVWTGFALIQSNRYDRVRRSVGEVIHLSCLVGAVWWSGVASVGQFQQHCVSKSKDWMTRLFHQWRIFFYLLKNGNNLFGSNCRTMVEGAWDIVCPGLATTESRLSGCAREQFNPIINGSSLQKKECNSGWKWMLWCCTSLSELKIVQQNVTFVFGWALYLSVCAGHLNDGVHFRTYNSFQQTWPR